MDLAQQLKNRIAGYLFGELSLDDLRDWLGDHVQDVHDSSDESLQDLDAKVWGLLSEWDLGHRDDASLRGGLAVLLEGEIVLQYSANNPGTEESVTFGDGDLPPAPGQIRLESENWVTSRHYPFTETAPTKGR